THAALTTMLTRVKYPTLASICLTESHTALHDMLNPTKDTNWNSTCIYKSRHKMLPINLTQETLFSSKSHGKYALFPIFTASWRATRIKNIGI
ncbi:hypothetical protein ACNER2_002089, partial [Shigella sonnei]